MSCNTRVQRGHRVKSPAWLLLRHQIWGGDFLHISIETVEVDVRLGKDVRFAIPWREYEAIDEYWLKQPVLIQGEGRGESCANGKRH